MVATKPEYVRGFPLFFLIEFSLPDSSPIYDLIIIGAGAAGLMAATSAAGRGLRVLLLEKNKKLGVKILISGGTRCNITHHCSVREIVKRFGKRGNFLHSPLHALPPDAVIEKIEAQGVATKIEHTGKIFPVSDRAIDVRDALVTMAKNSGAQIISGCAVQAVTQDGDNFSIATPEDHFQSKNVLITTGGLSYPGCGTTGDGYAWAKQFGHTITQTVPALVPLLNNCTWANDLKGITIENAGIDVWQPPAPTPAGSKPKKEKPLARATGSFLFTHFGFSGPTALDVSREVALHPDRKTLSLNVDFLPDLKPNRLHDMLDQKRIQNGKQITGNLLNEIFPKRLAESLLAASGVHLDAKNAELSKASLAAICQQIKHTQFALNGTLGFEKAEVTAGGVSLDEVDSSTMQSKLHNRLFFAGEVLDLDGPIGGFNFQSAFSTGWLAGQSVEATA